jgi:hypothetical protein
MHMTCSKKVVAYYTRKHINFKNQIFVIILKDDTLNLQGMNTNFLIHIYSNIIF